MIILQKLGTNSTQDLVRLNKYYYIFLAGLTHTEAIDCVGSSTSLRTIENVGQQFVLDLTATQQHLSTCHVHVFQ